MPPWGGDLMMSPKRGHGPITGQEADNLIEKHGYQICDTYEGSIQHTEIQRELDEIYGILRITLPPMN